MHTHGPGPSIGSTSSDAPKLAELPSNAIVPGIAQGDKANRVGVYGTSGSNYGVVGESATGVAVWATSSFKAAMLDGPVEITGACQITGDVELRGNMHVTGDIQLTNADFAEDFDTTEPDAAEPGTVMIFGAGGLLRPCETAYDKRVAGIVAGAGTYRPGIILNRHDRAEHAKPITLVGRACCKVDAQFGAIEVGDLLTTSPARGHAMKAGDPLAAFGTVIGKALEPHAAGQGTIAVLVGLR